MPILEKEERTQVNDLRLPDMVVGDWVKRVKDREVQICSYRIVMGT